MMLKIFVQVMMMLKELKMSKRNLKMLNFLRISLLEWSIHHKLFFFARSWEFLQQCVHTYVNTLAWKLFMSESRKNWMDMNIDPYHFLSMFKIFFKKPVR